MPKGFPYFKFVATEYLTGEIMFEDLAAQGLFTNICALYWAKDGALTVSEVNKRYKRPELLESLSEIIKVDEEGNISVTFLDEQLKDAGIISKKNSDKGKKSAAAKAAKTKENSTTVEQQLTGVQQSKVKQSNTKQEKVKQSKEEKDKEFLVRKQKFAHSLEPFLETYGRDMLNAFYAYWVEPNKSGTKFRQELEKTWDLERRLNTWASRDKNFKPPDNKKPNFNEHIHLAAEARSKSDQMLEEYAKNRQQ